MGIENLKYWHWAIIGVLLGAMFGASRAYWRDPDPGGEDSFDRLQFTNAIERGMDVRNLVLHPPIDGQEWLTGEAYKLEGGRFGPRLMRQRPGTTQPARERPGAWVPFPMLAGETNSKRRDYQVPNPVSAVDYLAQLEKQFPRVREKDYLAYKVAWWEYPKYTVAIYAFGGLVVIGGVFATIVNVLTGAGFGPQKKVKDDYDLSRFKSGPEPVAETAKPEVNDDQLHALNAKLEENVADMFIAGSSKSAIEAEDEEEAAAIKQLQTQSMDAVETTAEREAREAKEYKGEFYPVVKPGGQKGTKP